MNIALLVGLGSMLGALSRYAITSISKRYVSHIHIFHRSLKIPLGVILVNTLGCFLIGMFSQLALESPTKEVFQASLIIGYLGGLTTYSSFGFESYTFIKEKRYGTLLTYILMQLIIGLAFVWLGIKLVVGTSL